MKTARPRLSLVVVVLLLLCAVSAWAKGTGNVANTVHNLSSSAPYIQYKSDESEICIFCHTPHGGLIDGPLWNHSLPTGPWTHYNSTTLSDEAKVGGLARAVNDESLLCMSCHDGSISTMHLINKSNALGRNPNHLGIGGDNIEIMPLGPFPTARIGGSLANPGGTGDLSDDHPISFSYQEVVQGPDYTGSGAKVGQLYDVATAEAGPDADGGVRFFGDNKRMECSSCHDPHVDYEAAGQEDFKPFLYRPNTGSRLCLTCHNK